jgi:hypothetical protein
MGMVETTVPGVQQTRVVDYYVWGAKGKPVQVRLSLPMTLFMVRWIRDRAAQQPETFGMLLGRVRRGWRGIIVSIDDFEPFDPATLRGSPQPPRGSELKVVGLYRRREGDQLALDQLDASLIQTSFAHPGMVYLLLAPSPGAPDRAAFFIQEHGEVHGYSNYGEFPFDAGFLRRPALESTRAGNWRWIPAAGLVASLLALAGWFYWLRQGGSTPPISPAVAQKAAAIQPQPTAESPVVTPPKPNRRTVERHRKRPPTSHRKRRRLVS